MSRENAFTTDSSPILYPWTPAYWRAAVHQLRDLRILTTVAMLVALTVVLTMFVDIPVPLGNNLRIRFDFLAEILFCMIGGPILGLIGGMAGDLIGYLCHPLGEFFPGYTLSAMLACLVYSFFFFRARVTVVKIILCRLSINLFVNVLLGSVWSWMTRGNAYLFYVGKSAIKNSIMLPIEIVLILLVLSLLMPVMAQLRLIPRPDKKWIPIV